jgi:hypothetical protein
MDTLLAGVIGALVGLIGVGAGAWLQGRKEHQRWLRDQKLHAAVDFIGATGDIYDRRRSVQPGAPPSGESAQWARAQDARSALYLLCAEGTVDAAEALIKGVRHFEARADGSHDDQVIALLQDLVRRLRQELAAGAG